MGGAHRHDPDEATRPQQRFGNGQEYEDDVDTLAAEDFGHPCKLSEESFRRARDFLRVQLKPCLDNPDPFLELPSMSAMNAFFQLYFEHFAVQLPFIHAPTFEPDNATGLLLIAVANIGCHYSRSRHRRLYRSLFMQVLRDSIRQQVSLVPGLSCHVLF